MKPLLTFAAAYVPKVKHKETPLYIMCTAGMRLLPDKWVINNFLRLDAGLLGGLKAGSTGLLDREWKGKISQSAELLYGQPFSRVLAIPFCPVSQFCPL